MKEIINLSRRNFLKTGALMGGGLVLGVYLPSCKSSKEPPAKPGTTFVPNAFLRIGHDNTVTIVVHKSEMGQGVYTSLPMLVAEELEADWTTIRVDSAPVAPAYNHTLYGPIMVTGGSTSVRSEWERLRKAGAAARMMLIAAAAATWKANPVECRAVKGAVVHSNGKTLTYGQLTDKAVEMAVPEEVKLKDPAKFAVIGRSVPRLDTPDKTHGKALFGMDIRIPGMLTAVIARSPVFGGKVKSFHAGKAEAVPGVQQVVQIDAGVAVVADRFWQAERGREALEIEWDDGPLAGLDSTSQLEEFTGLAQTPGLVAQKKGDPEQALAKTHKVIRADFDVPYLAHAPMEPLNCTVDLQSDGCEIWTGSQFQTVDRDAAARTAGLQPEQVKMHTPYLGGGFGRRANPSSDFVIEAVQVAKAVKKPVKVVWTREDDIKGGWYRPMWVDRISAGLDEEGNITSWKHTIVGQSIIAGTAFEEAMVKDGIDETSVEGAKDIPYDIPNILVDLHTPSLEVPVIWWRSVGHSHTAFVVETFIDELAHETGQDPFEFRVKLLQKHPRHQGVLNLAAQKSDWGSPLPQGRGRGIAVHESFGSWIAQVAEVSVNPEGKVRVHKVDCAIDCGRVVNPDTVEAQMESGIVFGLTAALFGAITFKNGRVEQSNFHDYEMVRINEMPEVRVHIVPSKEPPGGVGEPGVPPIAPAVVNAVFAATGKRIRRLPIPTSALKNA